MRFHDLRHTAITLMLKMGIPAHVVSEIAGHSSVSFTLSVYGHVLKDMHEDAMHKMGAIFRPGTDPAYQAICQRWQRYHPQIQEKLETLLRVYGEGAAQLALDALACL